MLQLAFLFGGPFAGATACSGCAFTVFPLYGTSILVVAHGHVKPDCPDRAAAVSK